MISPVRGEGALIPRMLGINAWVTEAMLESAAFDVLGETFQRMRRSVIEAFELRGLAITDEDTWTERVRDRVLPGERLAVLAVVWDNRPGRTARSIRKAERALRRQRRRDGGSTG